ncbi:hypothetical protein V7014_18465 [Bacillus sp. JJ722]
MDGAGWANCHIEIDSKQCSFSPSYLTNALGDLLQALLEINPLYTEEAYIVNGTHFFWDEEPEQIEWNFRYLFDGKMSLRVTSHKEVSDTEILEKVELSTNCSYDEFLGEVLNEVERILKEYGIIGYKNMWIEHDFPLSTFLQLKYYLENRTEFPITKRTFGHSEEIKSDIEMELNYLNGK